MGNELVRALRASPETDFLSIILLTAQAEDEQRLEGLERGADEYIVKPFEMRELDVRVRNLILVSTAAARAVLGCAGRASRSRAVVESDVAPADQAYVAQVRDAIRRGLANPDFGVGELADAVSQDRSHLFRRVKQLFGESPSDLIRRMRVEEGERLLLSDRSATVTDVAYAVGFNSLSLFLPLLPERVRRDARGVSDNATLRRHHPRCAQRRSPEVATRPLSVRRGA